MNQLHHYRNHADSFYKLTRVTTCSVAAFISATMCLLNGLPIYNALMVWLIIFSMTAFGNAINDYFDFEKDLLHPSKHMIAAGRITREQCLKIAITLLLFCVFLVQYLYPFQQIVCCLVILILCVYSHVNNNFGILANILVSTCVAFSILVTQDHLQLSLVTLSSFCVFFVILAREIILDTHDADADRAIGKTSIPILFNKNNAFLVSFTSLFLSSVLSVAIGVFFAKYTYIIIMTVMHLSLLSCILNYQHKDNEASFDAFVSYSRLSFLLFIPAHGNLEHYL